ncbi:MAG: DUF3572 domain-containing protein [Paracoccaceae bacterium]|nr:MAG: DUF3572 domain-containing protein [Paracoccaceae bacterium]
MNRQEAAETLALQAVGWLASDADRLGGFLAATGASPADLRRGMGDPAFLGAVLDFILAEDDRVIDCARSLGVPPVRVAEARAALPGGDSPHWT